MSLRWVALLPPHKSKPCVSWWWRQAAPSIKPAAIELPVSGTIAGIPVVGVIDILDTSGRVIDLKTASERPQGISASHYNTCSLVYAMLTAPAAPPSDPDWPTAR